MKKKLLVLLLVLVAVVCFAAFSASAEEEHKHCVCGGSPIDADYHSCADVTWQPLPEGTTDFGKLPKGNYYLTGDVTVTSYSTQIKVDLKICLNGHNINTNVARVFGNTRTSSGKLTVTDCSYDAATKTWGGTITGGDSSSGYGSIIYTHYSSKLNIYGGNWTGNGKHIRMGGLIVVAQDGAPDTKDDAGNVTLKGTSDPTKAATLNLYGGKLYGGLAGTGGAIHVMHCSKMNMYGGTITDNNAKFKTWTADGKDSYKYGQGGNIYTDSGTVVHIYDGVITNGTAKSGGTITSSYAVGSGGNIYASGDLYIHGGVISNGYAEQNTRLKDGAYVKTSGGSAATEIDGRGGNIYAIRNLTISGGQIYAGKANGNGGGNIYYNAEKYTFTFSGGMIWGGEANADKDAKGTNIVNAYDVCGGSVRIQYGTFNMTGGSIGIDAEGKPAGGTTYPSGSEGGNIYFYSSSITASLSGGKIAYGNVTGLDAEGNEIHGVTSKGGNIAGGAKATYSDNIEVFGGYTTGSAGNITMFNNGNAKIKGGKIYDGKTAGNGGNIAMSGDTKNVHTLEITGGEIYGGTAVKGGNIYIDKNKVVNISGDVKIYDGVGTTSGGNIGMSETSQLNIGKGVKLTGSETLQTNGANIYASGTITITIDGAELTGGYATGSGASIFTGAAVTLNISNSTVRDGKTTKSGGGNLYATGKVTLTNVDFIGGESSNAGGSVKFTNNTSEATLTGCTFDGGYSPTSGGNLYSEGAVTIENCTFKNGQAGNYGGNLAVGDGSVTTVTGCTFEDGKADDRGGNVYGYNTADLTLNNCTLKNGLATNDTKASSYGGNLYSLADTLTINGGIFEGGVSQHSGNMYVNSGTIVVTGATIKNGEAILQTDGTTNGNGGNIQTASGGDATFIDCIIEGGKGQRGGSIACFGKTTFTDCTIGAGEATFGGGTIFTYENGSLILNGTTTVAGGKSGETGGAIQINSFGEKAGTNLITDTVKVTGGTAEQGYCIMLSGGTLELAGNVNIAALWVLNTSEVKMIATDLACEKPINVSANYAAYIGESATDKSGCFVTNDGYAVWTAPTTEGELGVLELIVYKRGNFTSNIGPNRKHNIALTNAGGMIMTVPNIVDATITYAGTVYEADANGVITITFPAGRPGQAYEITLNNNGTATQKFEATFAFPVGHMENPDALVIGENTAAIAEGNTTGYNYTYTAEKTGTLVITMPETGWMYCINNLTTYKYGDTVVYVDGSATAEIAVNEGDLLQIMVNTFDPANPFAAPAGTITFTAKYATYVAEANGVKYETLGEALAQGGNVTLLKDITLTEKTTVEGTVTLNLGGYTLTTYAENGNYGFVVKGDLTIEGEGNVVVCGVYGIGVLGNLTVNGGTFMTSPDSDYMIGNYGTTTINGGEFTGVYCVLNNFDGHTATVTGGTFVTAETDATGEYEACDLFANAGLTVTGGTFSKDITEYCAKGLAAFAADDGTYYIGDALGTINNPISVMDARQLAAIAVEGETETYFVISPMMSGMTMAIEAKDGISVAVNGTALTAVGGVYYADIVGAPTCRLVITNTAEATTLTGKAYYAVAAADGIKYETLAEAVEAGNEVTLLTDASGAGIVINKDVTIDFGGYTYEFTSGVGSTGTTSNGLQILKGNEVTLKNGTLKVAQESKELFYILVQNYADLTVADMTLDGTNLDKWSTTDGDSYTLSNNSGNVQITGETNIIANDEGDLAFAMDSCNKPPYEQPVVTVTTTGTISGKIEVSATLAISSGTYTVPLEKAWCAEGFAPTANDDGTFGVRPATYVAEANGEKFETLAEAVEAGNEVTLLTDASGAGIVINKDVTIDFGGYTYEFTSGVGSTGTTSNGLQILKGNEVTLKNGTLKVAQESKELFYILVQNYADLTVMDMTLDGTNLDKWSTTDGDSYTLSNNCGNVQITGETNIIANDEGDLAFAMDSCNKPPYEQPVVTVTTTGTITGKIEVSATLQILSGTYTEALELAWCANGMVPVKNADGTYGVDYPTTVYLQMGENALGTIASGESAYFALYFAGQYDLSVAGGTIGYNGTTYETLTVCGNYYRNAMLVEVTNTGDAAAAMTLIAAPSVGTMENPAQLVMGSNTAKIAEGNNQGYNFTWTAVEDGVLTITMPAGDWMYTVNNLTTYQYGDTQWSDSDPAQNPAVITVNKGDMIQLVVGSYNPADMWATPAAELNIEASFEYALGTAQNPIMVEWTWNEEQTEATASVTIPAGKTYNYTAYVSGMELTVNGESYGLLQGSRWMPATFAITNDTDAEATYELKISYPTGTQGNPAQLVIGSNTAVIAEGNNQGYFFTYTATETGALVITMPAGDWMYVINNMTTYQYGDMQWSDSDPVVNPAVVSVNEGDVLQIMVNSYDPANPWTTPAAELTFTAATSQYVAQVGEKQYVDLATAVKEANGETVILLQDLVLTEKLVLEGTATLDMNWCAITTAEQADNYSVIVKGDLTLDGYGTWNVNGVYGIGVTGKLTVKNGYFYAAENNDYMIGNWGTTTIEGGMYYGIYCVVNNFAGTTVIDGGEFNTEEFDYTGEYESCDVFADAGLTIVSGMFSKDVTEYCAEGKVCTDTGYGMYTVSDPFGTEENPVVLTELENTVVNTGTMYYMTYSDGMIMTITGEEGYSLTIGGETIVPEGGVYTTVVTPIDYLPMTFAITGDGTYTVNFVYPIGAVENPDSLVIGENTTTVGEDSWGYYYTWTATGNGTLTITGTEGMQFNVNNLTSYVYGEYMYGAVSYSVAVAEGDEIQVSVNTYNPESWFSTPAGTITFTAAFEAEGGNEPEGPVVGEGVVATPDEPIMIEYTAETDGILSITVSGTPGFKVEVYDANGETVGLPATGKAEETLTYELTAGTYTIRMVGYANWDEASATINYSISFAADQGGETEKAEYEVDYNTALVVGDNTVTLLDTAITTIYAFEPTEEGTYTITAPEGAIVGYWGAGEWFLNDPMSTTNSTEWKCTGVGQAAYIGISGIEGEFTVTVEKTAEGEAPEQIEYAVYENVHTFPEGFNTLTGEETLLNVDITEAHTAVLGDDGYYHLDSATGPVLYVDLQTDGFNISVAAAPGGANVMRGEVDGVKYDFLSAMTAYNTCDVYPLTEDTMKFVKGYGKYQGWFVSGMSPFAEINEGTANADTAWMVLCRYVEVEEEPTPELFEIDVARMILGNALQFQFGVDMAKIPDTTGYYAVIEKTWADGSVTTKKLPASEWGTVGKYYAIVYQGLAAKEMADTFYVTIYNADGVAVSYAKQDAVRDYVARAYKELDTLGKTMVIDMLNYGAAAQVYFTYNTEDLANNQLTDEQKASATAETPAMENKVVVGEHYTASRFILSSSIQVQVGFEGLTEDMYAVYTYVDYKGLDREYRIEGKDFVVYDGKLAGVELSKLVYADARCMVSVTVYNADGTVYGTATDSIESCAFRGNGDLFVALMKFADSARAKLSA